MKLTRWVMVCGIGLAAQAAPAAAASFDCAKARTATEHAICASPLLSELDDILGRYYPAARRELEGDARQSCLVADQRRWLAQRNRCAADAACLRRTYLERLFLLDDLLPGVVRSRRLNDFPDKLTPRTLNEICPMSP